MSNEHHSHVPTSLKLPKAHQKTTGSSNHFPGAALVCDLAETSPFAHSGAPAAVLIAFGGGPMHAHRLYGGWNVEQAVADCSADLFRSRRARFADERQKECGEYIFRYGPVSFLCIDGPSIVGYATTLREAEEIVTKFDEAYKIPLKPAGGAFHLIRSGREIGSESVPLGAETILSDDSFRLHYGSGSLGWHQDLAAKLNLTNHGLTIFEGPPGTGKTSYLRHLMGVLKSTHRFYFIPPATMSVLSSPDFIGFWAEQRRLHADNQFVIVLEDSDAALMTRGSDNRAHVSAILNLSDGMLADFLRLHIICTINCRAADIDQALLRPGRLLCHHVFRPLGFAEASSLAGSLGKKLPTVRDYSLAEVFAGDCYPELSHVRIGFAG